MNTSSSTFENGHCRVEVDETMNAEEVRDGGEERRIYEKREGEKGS